MFGGSTVPSGWLLCDGAAVSRTTYAALFAAIGTAFGTGNGTTTFNLPDLLNRFPVGAGGSYALGASGGDSIYPLGNSVTVDNNLDGSTTVVAGGSDAATGTPPYLAVSFIIKT